MKRMVVIPLLIVLCMLTLGMSICQRFALINCDYEFTEIEPHLDMSNPLDPQFTMDAGIQIYNPNDIDVIVDKIKMDFFANETKIFAGEPTPGDTVATGDTDTLVIPMVLDYWELGQVLVDAIVNGEVSYELIGTIYLESEMVNDSFPITLKKGEI